MHQLPFLMLICKLQYTDTHLSCWINQCCSYVPASAPALMLFEHQFHRRLVMATTFGSPDLRNTSICLRTDTILLSLIKINNKVHNDKTDVFLKKLNDALWHHPQECLYSNQLQRTKAVTKSGQTCNFLRTVISVCGQVTLLTHLLAQMGRFYRSILFIIMQ